MSKDKLPKHESNSSNMPPVEDKGLNSDSTPIKSLNANTMPKRRKLLIIAGSTIAGLALMAGGVSAYFGYYLPNQPENVIKQALANTVSQADLNEYAKINGELKVSGQKNLNANVKFDLQRDNSGGFDFEISSFGISAKLVSQDGKTIYVKVDGLKQADKLLEQFDGVLPLGDYESTIKATLPVLSNLSGNWYELDSSLLSGSDEQTKFLTGGLSQQQLTDLSEAYENNQFIIYDKKGQTAQVGSKQAVEYIVHIDGDKLVSFINSLKLSESFKDTLNDVSTDELQNFVNNNNLSDYPFSLWITDDKQIVRLSYSHQYNELKVEFNLTLDKSQENIKITKPENSKSVFELLIYAQKLLQSVEQLESQDLPSLDEI